MEDASWATWAFRGMVGLMMVGMIGVVKQVFQHDRQLSVLETRAEDHWEALSKALEKIDRKLDQQDVKVQELLNERRTK